MWNYVSGNDVKKPHVTGNMPLTETDCAATYKILVLGDASVGKTALLRCLVGKEFHEKTLPTFATDFVRKKFEVDGALVELHIWDTAGQERFRSVTRWQYRGVKGVVMVYDVTDQSPFAHLSYWIQSVNQEIAHAHNKYEYVPIVLLGNKKDLHDQRQVQIRDGKKLADKELTFGFYETSARNGGNVFDAFRKLATIVTEICNPDVMKSYHPYLLRIPTSPSSVEVTSRDVTARYKVSKNAMTLNWFKPKPKSKSTVKLKHKTTRKLLTQASKNRANELFN